MVKAMKDRIIKNREKLSGSLILLVMALAVIVMPGKVEAAQKPGVVDSMDLKLGGVYYAYPEYSSVYLEKQKKATKRVKKIYACYPNNSSNDHLYKTLEYDGKGNLIAIYEISGPNNEIWTTAFEYDAEGRMIRSNNYTSSGELNGWTIYDRDDNGNLIKMSSYTQITGDDPGSYFCYFYKNGKAVTTEGWAAMGGDVDGAYEYDVNGNLIHDIRGDIVVTDYEYDKQGRLTKQVTYTSDGKEVIQETEFAYDKDNYLESVMANGVVEKFVYEAIPASAGSGAQPTLTYDVEDGGTVVCKWSKVRAATGYIVYKRKLGSSEWDRVKATKKIKLME